MTKNPTNHDYGERWDESDVTALRAMLSDGATHEEAAQRLGRTKIAVDSKVRRLRKQGVAI